MTKLTHGVPGGASTLLGMLGTLQAEEPSEVRLDSSLTSKIEIYPKCQSSRSHNFWVLFFFEFAVATKFSELHTSNLPLCQQAWKRRRYDVDTSLSTQRLESHQMSRLRPKHRVKAHQAKDLKNSPLWHCESCEKH